MVDLDVYKLNTIDETIGRRFESDTGARAPSQCRQTRGHSRGRSRCRNESAWSEEDDEKRYAWT